jgi:regulator of protease activity HflC (stomatin/prohibitin superfamily)
LSSILIGLSFGSVEANEIALDYNMNTKTLNLEVTYENGLHFPGLGHSLIIFPKTLVDLDMQSDTIISRTRDGLIIVLGTRIRYSLETTIQGLATLYLAFGEEWEKPIYYLARAEINDIAANYNADEFWSNRESIQSAMTVALRARFKDFYCQLDSFSLSNFDLPSRFQTAIIETDVQKQNFEKVDFEKDTAITLRNTRVDAADNLVDAIEKKAAAEASAYLLNIDALVENMQIAAEAEAAAYNSVKTALGFSTAEFTSFIWLDSLSYYAKTSPKRYALSSKLTI